MKSVIISPRFIDLVIKQEVFFQAENSVHMSHEKGGYDRIFSLEYPIDPDHKIELQYLSPKHSVILSHGPVKTTLTESLPPDEVCLDMGFERNNLIFAYAEDIDWKKSIFRNCSMSRALVDFSGRFCAIENFLETLDALIGNFCEVYLFLTEHDSYSDGILNGDFEIPKNCYILYHTPRLIIVKSKENKKVIDNSYYISYEQDHVGYGDYLTLLVSQELHHYGGITENNIDKLQKVIADHINHNQTSELYNYHNTSTGS